MGDKPSFQNRSGDLCWLNSLLLLTLRALDLKSSVNLFSDLGRLIDTFRTRVPKNVFDASNIRSLLSHGQFEHSKTWQQCVVERFQSLSQTGEDGSSLWPDIADLFSFETRIDCSCASCEVSRELPTFIKHYVYIQIPENCYGRSLSSDRLKDLVETYSDQPYYK